VTARPQTLKGAHVALLRGINVGRAKRVAMADLRALVEDLGYSHVRTVLNSGNVVFTARAAAGNAAARIERALAAKLRISSRVTVLTADELAGIVTENPFPNADNASRFLVAVVNDPADLGKLDSLRKQGWGTEVLAVGKRAAYLWCPDGILAGKLIEAVSRALGDGVTTRNWATINKLHALTKASAADGSGR